MKNKGKPQGLGKVLRWRCINPLLSFQTSHQPLSASSECTAAAGNTRSHLSKKGCGLIMLGFSTWHFTTPRKPKESNYSRWNWNYTPPVRWPLLQERRPQCRARFICVQNRHKRCDSLSLLRLKSHNFHLMYVGTAQSVFCRLKHVTLHRVLRQSNHFLHTFTDAQTQTRFTVCPQCSA